MSHPMMADGDLERLNKILICALDSSEWIVKYVSLLDGTVAPWASLERLAHLTRHCSVQRMKSSWLFIMRSDSVRGECPRSRGPDVDELAALF